MLRRFAVYRVLCIAGVALPAIAVYRWLDFRDRLGWPAPPKTWDRVHDWVARGLHDLGIHLAGFLVKLCQVVGARADNFPEPFIRRLGRFHDAVPPRPFAEMRNRIARELGRPLGEVFSAVDETPLAAASLAQVHKASLLDGTAVVVKVQYGEVARLSRLDLACLRFLARVAGHASRGTSTCAPSSTDRRARLARARLRTRGRQHRPHPRRPGGGPDGARTARPPAIR
jgi:ubiquinone biosynthesis protein